MMLVMLLPVLTNSAEIQSGYKKKTIAISGFLPIHQNHWDASGTLPALEMAILDINQRLDILPNHSLQLIWTDTKVK